MPDPVDRRRRPAPSRPADDGGTWRFRGNLTRVAVVMGLLGLGTAFSAAVSGFWPDYGAAVCWLVLSALAGRSNRRLAGGIQLGTRRRGVLALYGLGLFLLGGACIVAGRLLLG